MFDLSFHRESPAYGLYHVFRGDFYSMTRCLRCAIINWKIMYETDDLLTSRAFCNEKWENVNKRTCCMQCNYTYKRNVSYFRIPNGFSYSEAPCTTSTYCHLKTLVACFQTIASPSAIIQFPDSEACNDKYSCSRHYFNYNGVSTKIFQISLKKTHET